MFKRDEARLFKRIAQAACPFLESLAARSGAQKQDVLVHLLPGETNMLTFGPPFGMYSNCNVCICWVRLTLLQAMDDDEISCQAPQTSLNECPGKATYCRTLIELMRLSSTAKKRLSSARALKQHPHQLMETVCDLNKQLHELKLSIQGKICLDSPLEVSRLPEDITLWQAQSLQSHYFCLVLDVNTPLAYPWSSIHTYAKQHVAASVQIDASWNTVAQVSRTAILATRQIRVDASCSAL